MPMKGAGWVRIVSSLRPLAECKVFQFLWTSIEEFASNNKKVGCHISTPPESARISTAVKSESSLSTRPGPSDPSTSRKMPQEKPERLEELSWEMTA